MNMPPGSAVIWTLLVPGLAHVRLGHFARGLLCFATTVGMFFAGWALVGDRIWFMQLFEPFELLAPVLNRVPLQLLPEAPNLGCTIVAAILREMPGSSDPQLLYDWLRTIRLPVPHEHIGLFLTGASGIVAALWAVDAHWLAQRRPVAAGALSPSRAAAMSWLLPGLGHAGAGQQGKGLLMGAAVIAMFALGLLLSSGHAIDRPLRSAWWIGEVLFGGGTLFATFVTAPLPEGEPSTFIDHGVALCTVAGFMNLIVMIDAYTVAEAKAEETAQ